MDLNVENVASTCHSLEAVIQDAFGPRGLNTMITMATGKVLVTMDGATILGAMRPAHPLAKLITTSANEISSTYGSGCKTVILYLTGAAESMVKLNKEYNSSNFSTSEREFGLKIRKGIHSLINNHLLSDFEEKLIRQSTKNLFVVKHIKSVENVLPAQDTKDVLRRILHTELSTNLSVSPRLASFFTELLLEFLTDDVSESLHDNPNPCGCSQDDNPDCSQDRDKVCCSVCSQNEDPDLSDDKVLSSESTSCDCAGDINPTENMKPTMVKEMNSIPQITASSNQSCLPNLQKEISTRETTCSQGGRNSSGSNSSQDYQILKNARCFVDNFTNVCVKVKNLTYTQSKVVHGILVSRDFTVNSSTLNEKRVKFIVLRDSSDSGDAIQTNMFVEIKEEITLQNSLSQKQSKAEQFVKHCKTQGIKVVLSTSKMLDSSLYWCQFYAIAVVEYVSEEDADKICKVCDKLPVYDLGDVEGNICHAVSFESVRFGGTKFVQIKFEKSTKTLLGRQLILCAPGENLSNQICQTVNNCMKLVCHILPEKSYDSGIGHVEEHRPQGDKFQPLPVIQAGGAFELFTENYFAELRQKTTNDEVKLACCVLIEAVCKIPKALLRNSNSNSKSTYLQNHKTILSRISHGELLSLNACSGAIDPNISALEPAHLKIATLLRALLVCCQILKLDLSVAQKG